MIKHFYLNNFKSLVGSGLTLQPLTVLIGPNNAGKSNLFQALEKFLQLVNHGISNAFPADSFLAYVYKHAPGEAIKYEITFDIDTKKVRYELDFSYASARIGYRVNAESLSVVEPDQEVQLVNRFQKNPTKLDIKDLKRQSQYTWEVTQGKTFFDLIKQVDIPGRFDLESSQFYAAILSLFNNICLYHFDPKLLAAPSLIVPNVTLGKNGNNLAAVLDSIRDQYPDEFNMIEDKLRECVPEVDRITFQTTQQSYKQISVRDKVLKTNISAEHLSDGVLIFLALLTVIYGPQRPSIICLEEIEHGVHPRRLEQVIDFLTTLAYHTTPPTQVLLTTHSPYVLDLFKDRLEEVIIVEKQEGKTIFTPLTDRANSLPQLDGALGDLWYSGVFGGVPAL